MAQTAETTAVTRWLAGSGNSGGYGGSGGGGGGGVAKRSHAAAGTTMHRRAQHRDLVQHGFKPQRDAGRMGTAPRVVELVKLCVVSPTCRRTMTRELSVRTVRSWMEATIPNQLYVWVWVEYRDGEMPRHIYLNLLALKRHAPEAEGFRVVTLNASSLSQWISPLPEEFFRLKHRVAASDFARIALLAVWGGIYLDADVLIAKPLTYIRSLLDVYEHVVYASSHQPCQMGVFSANWMAARPNTTLWRGAWERLQTALRSTCHRPKLGRDQLACCYNTLRAPIKCLTPWALTDKTVSGWGQISPSGLLQPASLRLPLHISSHHSLLPKSTPAFCERDPHARVFAPPTRLRRFAPSPRSSFSTRASPSTASRALPPSLRAPRMRRQSTPQRPTLNLL